MTSNPTDTPVWVEPLPPYSRHDPDSVSIHSATPSYSSEAPTYSSQLLSNTAPSCPPLLPTASPNQPPHGLPAVDYAPGFRSRRHGSMSNNCQNNSNTGTWSSTRTSHHSRQFEAIARRRANQTANKSANRSSGTSSVPDGVSPSTSVSAIHAYPVAVGTPSDPVSPLEDPYLVGEEAAKRARTQRVYREMCLREQEAAKFESQSWDFLLYPMTGWEERNQSRRKSRKSGRDRLLGRLGLRS